MAANGIIDAAGNNYGGTGVGSAGVGDTVKDVNNVVGTVTAILPGLSQALHKVLVRVTVPPSVNAHAVGNYEQTYYAQQLTITAHLDGTGLVSGGSAKTQIGDAPPGEYNYVQ